MPTWYNFVTLDVFTTTPYEGNPLAIVEVPENSNLTQEQKQKIAKEFNLSETVFLHPLTVDEGGQQYDIFTIDSEIPWAGHPTIGTICHIKEKTKKSDRLNMTFGFQLKAKAGSFDVSYDVNNAMASAEIPVNFHIHGKGVSSLEFLKSQPALQKKLATPAPEFPIASIVNGMNFVLIELTTLQELSQVSAMVGNIKFALDSLDEGWDKTLVASYFYVIGPSQADGTHKVRTRMMGSDIAEDPATGSAASDLACYLTSKVAAANLVQTFEIEQGVEMGRRSVITVRVELDDLAKIKKVVLSGQAVKVQEGRIQV